MLKTSQSRFFKGILVMLLMSGAIMLQATDPAPLKVLFIGNSHTMVKGGITSLTATSGPESWPNHSCSAQNTAIY